MATIHHELSINASAAKVYEALSSADQIGTWWDKQTAIQTGRGLVLEHNPGPEHGVVKLRVVGLIPNRRVEWECISIHPKSSPASAWTGTHFIFELAERTTSSGAERDQVRTTTLDFWQAGYDERSEYLDSNRTAWGEVLQNLKRVVESPRS
jgi:uncharacterized protein YndB with AHSA1/START domain